MKFIINLKEGVKLRKKDIEKIEAAENFITSFLNSKEFKDFVFNLDFHGETSEWKDKSRQEIYDHIMSGAEVLQPEIDGEADVLLGFFSPHLFNRGVIGRTWRDKILQEINRTYFRASSYIKVASNLLHEWLHKMGFQHDFKRTRRRKFSVCYQLGYALLKYGKSKPSLPPSDSTESLPTLPSRPLPKPVTRSVWVRFIGWIKNMF